MKILKIFTGCAVLCLTMASCSSAGQLTVSSVAYQSVKTRHMQPTTERPIPDKAKIAVAYSISGDGKLTAIVYNRTSEIMVIDQTKSFFVNSDGTSTSYYDPTVRTTSTTTTSSSTTGASLNLGALAGAFGIGGALGTLASGINVGGSGTEGVSTTNTTYVADLPQVSLAPRSNGAMSKVFHVTGLGASSMGDMEALHTHLNEAQSYCRFSVCITYSVDNGKTFEKLVTDFYANSMVIVPIQRKGKVNDALRQVYAAKSDLLYEPWWLLHFNSNIPSGVRNMTQGVLFDYQ